jgi:DNA-binding Lrp family transcriptional regulator
MRVKLSQFLASVNIFIDQSQKNNVLRELSKLPNAKEVYEVKGEYDIVSFISASSIEEFRDVLQKQVMKIKGVKSTITTVILSRRKDIIGKETKNDEGTPLSLSR